MYKEQKFNIPKLSGISEKNIEEHLKLYAGYIKHTNLILEKIQALEGSEADAYVLGELQRRLSFEWNGMRNHEYYFRCLEDGATELSTSSALRKAIENEWGSFEKWLLRFKTIALTRGVGWAILYYDREEKKLLNAWVDEQHLGQLNSAAFILGLDMWEHAFVYDYPTSEKKRYVEAFFSNLNWATIEKNFADATRQGK